jgi:hypothetical protein
MMQCILTNLEIITYIAEAFLQPFSDMDSGKLDALVEKVLSKSTLRSSARYHQPRLNYHRGFSRLTLLTASKHVGFLFACYVILHTEEGADLAKTVMLKQQEKIPIEWYPIFLAPS